MAQQGSVGTTGGVLAREADAERIVHGHVMWAMGAGLIPLPLFDIAAVTAVQMDRLKQLARVYSVDYSTAAGKTFAGALSGGTFAHVSAALLKFIPGSTQFWVGSLCQRCPAHPPMRWEARRLYEDEFENGQEVTSGIESRMKGQKTKYRRAQPSGGSLEGQEGTAKALIHHTVGLNPMAKVTSTCPSISPARSLG